ncbi:class I SAM-dependent methyltransferase [Blastococcus sp. TBT05-19]|uniref:class I SAM-dependent methyltransferase n=1 Tax=Blastococcus sp. TBT05-19 TaxID=2250581 RepID=UPI000DE9C936|nr:class I SAM-dependent methyltransferase [Blastococcus sp. TBT05-19]RBY91740.1 class I SAM-dependent methyltransferase [Blastococcus sp. TBT05-19]
MRVTADATALVAEFPPDEDVPAVLDVLMEGRRTVSFPATAATTTVAAAGGRRITFAWPTPLAQALSGRATLLVRDAADKRPLGTAEVAFGSSDDPLDLRDAAGRWLSVNKWGRLAPSFDGLDPAAAVALQDRLLDRLAQLQAELESLGIEPFVCYGTLLGAVRDGDLIPHDDDADLAYLSRHENPADVVWENLRLSRALTARGYSVIRHSGGHLQITFTDPDAGQDHYIDIFTAFRVEGLTYLCFQVGDEALDLREREQISLRGRSYPAPADSEALLAATYGPGWRVPDPSFTFTTPPRVRARLSTWIGEFNMARDYWQDFYQSPGVDRVPATESTFAGWVAERLPDGAGVLDVGTGTARDARFFARSGRRVLGLDYSSAAIERAQGLAGAEEWSADFRVLNLGDLTAIGNLVADLDWSAGWHLYARFLLHAIDDTARSNLWTLAGAVARRGGECWFEFRTSEDQDAPHVFGEHFRRYLSPDQVAEELAEHGMEVVERLHSQDLAPYKDENPWVARLRVRSSA